MTNDQSQMTNDLREGNAEAEDDPPEAASPTAQARGSKLSVKSGDQGDLTVKSGDLVPPADHLDSHSQPRAEVSMTVYGRRGPLPSPQDLRAYCDIRADFGERIVKMAEEAAQHRHKMGEEAVKYNLLWLRKGQSLAVVVVLCVTLILLAVVAAAVWIANATTALGGIVLGSSPVGLIGLLMLLRGWRRSYEKPGSEMGNEARPGLGGSRPPA